MSRRISEDFSKLSAFLNEYSLAEYSANQSQLAECKAMHKKLYGLMIFIAEYIQQLGNAIISIYLDETASDLLLSLFSWVQGMYKPAKLELRCAIENFLKAIISVSAPKIVEEKIIFEVFKIAKSDKHISNDFGQPRGDLLRNDYVVLCRTVHSVTEEIHSTSALNLLPNYNSEMAKEFVTIYLRTVESILGILYFNYPSVVDKMHPENKADFLGCLSKSVKKEIAERLYN